MTKQQGGGGFAVPLCFLFGGIRVTERVDKTSEKRHPAKKRNLWQEIARNREAYYMLLPVLVGFFVFIIYPNIWVMVLSFYKYNGIRPPQFIGLENYVRAFTRDPNWWISVWNTFVFAGGKLLVEIPMALACAVLLNRNMRGRGFLRAVYFMPNVTSAAVMGLVFYFIFSPYQGILNGFFMALGVIRAPIEWLAKPALAMMTVMSVSVWQNFGINMVLFLAGLQGVPIDVYESGDIDGCTGFKRFWYLTLPMLSGMFQIILMLAIIGSLKVFDTVQVMTKGGPNNATSVMMTYLFKYFFPNGSVQAQVGFASSLGVIAALIIGVVTVLYLFLSRKMDDTQAQ